MICSGGRSIRLLGRRLLRGEDHCNTFTTIKIYGEVRLQVLIFENCIENLRDLHFIEKIYVYLLAFDVKRSRAVIATQQVSTFSATVAIIVIVRLSWLLVVSALASLAPLHCFLTLRRGS